MKRILSIPAAAALMLCAVPQNTPLLLRPAITASAADTSGSCGEHLTWTLDSSGTLTVSGKGSMDSWSSDREVPWNPHSAEIKKAVIADGVTNIGNCAFDGCTNLTDAEIPDSVRSVGSYAFNQCGKLTEITLPWNVTFVGAWAFCECAALKSITILNYDCNIISNSQTICTEIIDDYKVSNRSPFSGTIYSYKGSSAAAFAQQWSKPFSAIAKPVSGTWGENLTWEFDGKDTLNISGSGNMADFSIYPLWNALRADVTKAVIADGITSIGANAFKGFGLLTEIVIPESVRHVSADAFSGTQWLSDRIAEDPLVIVNSTLYTGRTCKGKVTIPEGVEEIADYAFYKTWDMKGIEFPESLKSIGREAFYNDTELRELVLPAGVAFIGENAFGRCLSKITIPNSKAVIGENAFSSDITIAGYDGSTAEAYAKEHEITFESLGAEPAEPAFTPGDVNGDSSVDLKDVTVMRRALAGWNVTVISEAADVNKDGSFDLKDVVILRRYLAGGWGVELK